MQDYWAWGDLKERVMGAAPKLAEQSSRRSFTVNVLARELGMEDTQGKRQLSLAVNQLVDEGRLRRYPGLSEPLSIGRG